MDIINDLDHWTNQQSYLTKTFSIEKGWFQAFSISYPETEITAQHVDLSNYYSKCCLLKNWGANSTTVSTRLVIYQRILIVRCQNHERRQFNEEDRHDIYCLAYYGSSKSLAKDRSDHLC